MRHLHLSSIALSLCFICMAVSVSAQWEEADFEKEYLFERPNSLSLKSTVKENETYRDWNLTYNCLNLQVDPSVFYLKGSVDFEFMALKDGLSSITIDLNKALTVKSVTSGGKNLLFDQQQESVIITLATPLVKSGKGSFTISYEGIPTTTGFGSIFQTMVDGTTPALATLSEPFGAKEWWPCKQSLNDKIDSIDVIVETPMEYRTASNGILISDKTTKGKRVCHWKHRHPIATYLVFFSSTDYDTYSDYATLSDGTRVEILNYVYRSSSETARQQTPVTADYIEFFSRKFIDYPFKNEKYGHAQFSWGGGMEHQTMSSMGLFIPGLIAHELAHQWFGDYITCGSWNDIWLNEGFATYLEGLTNEAFQPDWWPTWKTNTLNRAIAEPGGSVYCTDTEDINRIFSSRLSYRKGAFILHQLRGQIGDSLFFSGMKSYLTDPRVVNGFATTDLFRENMESVADTTLTEFFNDWVFGEGYPIYDVEWNYANQQVNITIYQEPSVSNSPFFDMKLPISITVNGKEETYWLHNTQQGQQFSIAVPASPDSVVFNKALWILCKEANFHTRVSSLQSPEIIVHYNATEKYITTNLPASEQADYSIFDLQGRKIESGVWKKNNPVISVAQFERGIYIVAFSTPHKTYLSKFSCY